MPARYTVISDVQIEFDVPLEATGDHHATLQDVRLYIFKNGTWVNLPVHTTEIKNGRVLCRAGSPEFSLFAITIRNKPYSPPQEPSFTALPEPENIPGDESRKPAVPAFSEPILPPLTPVRSAGRQDFMPFFAGITVVSGIVTGTVLIRHRLIHRQDPPSL